MGIPGTQGAQNRLGRYELLARLAAGGMGEIFLARLEGAEGFEKLFVIKRILPHLADDARFRQMLIAEARIASKLSHANICQVYELGETAGQLYIVMEYLEGVTLLPVLRRASKAGAPLELGLVAGVLQQVCDALHYAHELKERGEPLGIVHRDVTPSNIFLTEAGVVKVLDFGIAKARGASTQTQEGTVKGKYAYMAPEQLRGAAAIDRRVDVFALGIVIYEMLALRRLFQRTTDYLTFRAVMEQPIPDIRKYRPDTPEPVAQALARALDREPANRHDSARQLATALLDALAGNPRPWTQGELGDYVQAHFADDIGKRSQQVANALGRTQPGATTRTTMPLIAHDDEPEPETGAEDEFPSVETDLEPAAPRPMAPAPRAASQPGDFVAGTPPPFGVESTGSAPSLQPLRTAAPGTAAAVAPRRSLLWPIVAVSMILVAAGALFLVWQQMQRQQDEPKHQIVIQQQPSVTEEPEPARAPATTPPGGAVQATPIANAKLLPHREPPVRVDPYDAALRAKNAAVNGCLLDHKQPEVPKGATIVIARDGRPASVSLVPANLAATPLGECLKNVLVGTRFPSAADEKQVWVPFVKK